MNDTSDLKSLLSQTPHTERSLPNSGECPSLRQLADSHLLAIPSLPAEGRENQLGTGAHVDWGMLTILLQDDVGGLEVNAHETVWQAATPVPDSFVIVLGEMVLRLTDGF